MKLETAHSEGSRTESYPIIESRYLNSTRKRFLDLVFGAIGMLALVVMFIPVAILIKLDSPGPVFHRQRRLGRSARVFLLLKFRTMGIDAESPGKPVFTQAEDPRVTRVGKLLRRSYLDEFPQWWNVIKGEMSVVGPRPERPEISDQIIEQYPRFELRTMAKPGITGLAQIQYGYVRSMEGSRHKLSYDQLYIQSASFKVELWIVLKTVIRLIRTRGT